MIILTLFLILLPIFYLPITTDFFEFNKMALLFITSLILLLLWCLKIITERKVQFFTTPFTIPILLFALITTISLFWQSSYKMGSLLSPLGPITILCTLLLYIIITNNQGENLQHSLSLGLIGSGVLLAALSLLSLFSIFGLPNPNGTIYLTSLYLLLPVSFLLSKIISQKSPLFIAIFIFIIISEIALLISLKNSGITVLPYQIGFSILKSLSSSARSLILGIGSGNFLTAFTLARPAELNYTPYWNILFTTSSSYLLTLATELGFIAGLIFLFFPLRLGILAIRGNKLLKNPIIYPLFIAFLIQIFTISNITIFVYTFILLSLISTPKKILDLHLKRFFPFLLAPLILIVTTSLILFILASRVYLAEVYFKKSLDAIPKNLGQEVYDFQKKAIRANPYPDKYHSAFSQTSLALANALAGKKDLTKDDNQKILLLTQQAIDESRVAASLGIGNVNNWTNLAAIYTSLMKLVQGSDERAISAYQQAIALNPQDPQSQLSLGGIYYAKGDYDEAAKYFQKAISLKKDWANAHYNLAATYKALGKIDEAKKEMAIVLSLVPVDSTDYKKAQEELEKLNSM